MNTAGKRSSFGLLLLCFFFLESSSHHVTICAIKWRRRTAWKVSKYGVSSGPYLETFRAVAHVAFNNYMTVLQTNNYKLNFGYFAVRVAVDLKLIWNWKFKPKKLFIHDGRFSTNEHNRWTFEWRANNFESMSNILESNFKEAAKCATSYFTMKWQKSYRVIWLCPIIFKSISEKLMGFFFILIHFLFYVSLN